MKMNNAYLSGNYAPVDQEVTVFDLPVAGELPQELAGRYVRNGPNPADAAGLDQRRWFTGDGMVHGVRLDHGRAVWYRNRYVGSSGLSALRGQGDVAGPNWNGASRGANTNVDGIAGRTFATVEGGGSPVELTYELETVGRNNFFGTLPGPFSGHAKTDPLSGETHAMVYALPQWLDHVQYVVLGTDGLVRTTLDVPMEQTTMMHDMSLTERYAVIFDLPVRVDRNLVAAGKPFPLTWQQGSGARVGLLPRDGGSDEIRWVEVPECYSFHAMNAYDQSSGAVIIDLCVYDSMFDVRRAGPIQPNLARLERWVLNPETRTSSVVVIDEHAQEFPRHRTDLTAQEYRYGYTAGTSRTGEQWTTIKHDLQTGQRVEFDHGPGRGAGEPVFVARESSTAEDDGWLMTYVHDEASNATELVVLDAQDVARGYIAQVSLSHRIPVGFHGNWISDNQVPPPA